MEIWNHSANHWGVNSHAAIHDQVVGGLREIQEQLPAARGKVWGFAPPSVSKGDYLGFRNGARPSQWDTHAGRLILRHHAVASAYLPNTAQRILDGNVRDGLAHVTIERLDSNAIREHLTFAETRRTGFQMMLHPSQLDLGGKLSSKSFEAVMDHIADLQEGGRIRALSPYELLLANSEQPTPNAGPWRSLRGFQVADASIKELRIRRRQDEVHVMIDALVPTNEHNQSATTRLPPEYRPVRNQLVEIHSDRGARAELQISPSGAVGVRFSDQSQVYRGNVFYWTS
ncbi:hypothetical protein ACFQRD_09050 [Brachybacterium sp. GCM10030268]|uniref:hypothetical protein n=1 Tax=Brachybacterium sp. GCM10030268 TaxID=3273382 RepID=UPI003615CD5C